MRLIHEMILKYIYSYKYIIIQYTVDHIVLLNAESRSRTPRLTLQVQIYSSPIRFDYYCTSSALKNTIQFAPRVAECSLAVYT